MIEHVSQDHQHEHVWTSCDLDLFLLFLPNVPAHLRSIRAKSTISTPVSIFESTIGPCVSILSRTTYPSVRACMHLVYLRFLLRAKFSRMLCSSLLYVSDTGATKGARVI